MPTRNRHDYLGSSRERRGCLILVTTYLSKRGEITDGMFLFILPGVIKPPVTLCVMESQMEVRALDIRVKGLPPSPNAIGRSHWTIQAKNKKEWGEKIEWLAKVIKPPRPYLRASVHFSICVGDKRRHDPDNLLASVCKPSMDALVRAGVLVDDSIDNIELSFDFTREGERGFNIYVEEIQE